MHQFPVANNATLAPARDANGTFTRAWSEFLATRPGAGGESAETRDAGRAAVAPGSAGGTGLPDSSTYPYGAQTHHGHHGAGSFGGELGGGGHSGHDGHDCHDGHGSHDGHGGA